MGCNYNLFLYLTLDMETIKQLLATKKFTLRDYKEYGIKWMMSHELNGKGGILGEANNDGTIFVDKSIPSGSAKEKEVVASLF